MKKIKEKNKLPLTFRYIKLIDRDKAFHENGRLLFIKCEIYQTDFYIRAGPVKPLIRML